MKKLIILFSVISAFALIGCGSKEPEVAESGATSTDATAAPATEAAAGAAQPTTAPEATASGVQDTPVNALGDK